MSELINVGDWVEVTSYNGHTDHNLVGSRGKVVEQDGTYDYKLQWPLHSPAHVRFQTRYSWLRPDEVSLSEPPAPTTEDIDLRDAINDLPGLENASLTWTSTTDPVEFLYKYSEVLDDMLTYYKRVEAKHHELIKALAVINNV